MKREIKFRAFIGSGMEYNVGVSNHGAFYCYPDPKDTACLINTLYSKETPIMQFTGLLDKNGKEIYEGDILKVDEHNAHDVGTVYYKGTRFAVGKYGTAVDEWESIEIIGNIYQNKELLK